MPNLISSLLSFRQISNFMYGYVFSVSLLLFLEGNFAIEGRKIGESHHQIQHFHTVQLSSLLPSESCTTSTKELDKRASSLKLVHKHGPCSNSAQPKSSPPTPTEVLLMDQARVNSIHKKLSKAQTSSTPNGQLATDATTVPAKDGSTIGSANYVVQVGIGTPTKKLSFIFDTGSDLTWTQCKPCVRNCYEQKDPIFDPRQSSSYKNISCASTLCSSLVSATGNIPGCAGSTCVYGIQYGDSSYSVGFFGSETFTLTQADVFPNFHFGCGQNNQGLFRGSSGLLGLGRDDISLISQTASKYKKLFSYCLPSTPSATGFLSFGSSSSSAASFTHLSSSAAIPSSLYGLDFSGISLADKNLSISPSVFSDAGAIIDSGTVITRLPPDAYSALRDSFRKKMSGYPSAPALSILDTCYDFSGYKMVRFPKVGFWFKGGVGVQISAKGTFYVKDISRVCLAFAGNDYVSDVAIFGNVQQKTIEVVYDALGGRVGFAPGGCS